jgi:hypothetical protein
MYDDLLDDPKVQRLEPVLFKAWVNLLCLASRNDGVLPPLEDIAFSLRVDEGVAEHWLDELSKKGLIDEVEGETRPHNWDKRQFKSDNDPTAAERKRKQRLRGQETRDTKADVTDDVTDDVTRDVTEKSRVQSRADTEQSRAEQNAPRADDPKHWQEVQTYLKDRANDLTDWEIDFLHSVKWADSLTGPQTASLKAIRDKLKPVGQGNGQAHVVKRETPEWVAWIAYKQSLGQKTTFLEKLSELTVPTLWPPSKAEAA